MKKLHGLASKNVSILPMDEDALALLRDSESDEHLRAAYGEMYDGCVAHPKDYMWYTAWKISLPGDIPVGDLCFKGPPDAENAVEIGYGIYSSYEGKGYATEAVHLAVEWALAQKNCFYVLAQTEEGNRASERVLEKNGFVRCGEGSEGHLWEKERPDVAYLSIFMCIGLSLGLVLGASFNHQTLGMCSGLGIGTLLGILIDENERRHRVRSAKKDDKNTRNS